MYVAAPILAGVVAGRLARIHNTSLEAIPKQEEPEEEWKPRVIMDESQDEEGVEKILRSSINLKQDDEDKKEKLLGESNKAGEIKSSK